MTTWFVSRHPASREWALEHDIHADHWVSHLDAGLPVPGDTVIGTLPINMVHGLNQRGVRYIHLSMIIPEEWRGEELTLAELNDCELHLRQFIVMEEDLSSLGLKARSEQAHNAQRVHVAIASGAQLQNFLPILSIKPDYVYLLVSDDSKIRDNARRFKKTLEGFGIHCYPISTFPSDDINEQRLFCIRAMAKIQANHPDAKISVNITGGTKLMSLALGKAIDPDRDIEVIYVDGKSDSFRYVEPVEKPAVVLPSVTRFDEVLQLQGISITSCVSTNLLWKEQEAARSSFTKKLTSSLYKNPNIAGNISSQLSDVLSKTGYSENEEPIKVFLDVKKGLGKLTPIFEEASELGLVRLDGNIVHLDTVGAVRFFGGGWLEEWCYRQLQGMEMDALAMGLRFVYDGEKFLEDENDVDVDLDVVALKNNRIILLECKTGQWGKEQKYQTAIHRLSAFREKLGEKMIPILVTLNKPSPPDLRKSKALNIPVIIGDEIRFLAEQIEALRQK